MVNPSESLGRGPGLIVNPRNNHALDVQISSRGFRGGANVGVRGVRDCSDGIPAAGPDGQGQLSHFRFASASRVEVLRGPFSALFGSSSGGLISTQPRRTSAQARKGSENITNSTRAGVVTPGIKAALESVDAGVAAASNALATQKRFEPAKAVTRARDVYRDFVVRFASIDDVAGAREALRQLLGGEIRIVSEDGVPYAEKTNAGPAGVCQLAVVAGARFDRLF